MSNYNNSHPEICGCQYFRSIPRISCVLSQIVWTDLGDYVFAKEIFCKDSGKTVRFNYTFKNKDNPVLLYDGIKVSEIEVDGYKRKDVPLILKGEEGFIDPTVKDLPPSIYRYPVIAGPF